MLFVVVDTKLDINRSGVKRNFWPHTMYACTE